MSALKQTVNEVFGHSKVPGEIGIEIEVEGSNLIRGPITPYWVFHEDHSLRGQENGEYVLRNPIMRNVVPDALENFFKAMKAKEAKLRSGSPNTSVHIHLNMQNESMTKVFNTIVMWYIFEGVLLEFSGSDRVGNLFCLGGQHAEFTVSNLQSAIKKRRWGDLAGQDGLRYSALNYTALSKFGSLEFRSLAGVYDKEIIQAWVEILLALKDAAGKHGNPADIINTYSIQGIERFIKSVFNEAQWKLISCRGYAQMMQEGMRLCQGIAFATDWGADDKKKRLEEPSEGQPVGLQQGQLRDDTPRDVNESRRRNEGLPYESVSGLWRPRTGDGGWERLITNRDWNLASLGALPTGVRNPHNDEDGNVA